MRQYVIRTVILWLLTSNRTQIKNDLSDFTVRPLTRGPALGQSTSGRSLGRLQRSVRDAALIESQLSLATLTRLPPPVRSCRSTAAVSPSSSQFQQQSVPAAASPSSSQSQQQASPSSSQSQQQSVPAAVSPSSSQSQQQSAPGSSQSQQQSVSAAVSASRRRGPSNSKWVATGNVEKRTYSCYYFVIELRELYMALD